MASAQNPQDGKKQRVVVGQIVRQGLNTKANEKGSSY